MRAARLLAGPILVVALLLPQAALAADPVEEITKEIMCQCGCTMIVNVCDCGQAEQIRQLIRDKLAEGQTNGQIMDYFVGQYGEKVLASPKKEGFNLTAYITPFVLIMAGGGAVSAAALAWARRGRAADAPDPAPSPPDEELRRYEDELERDLAEYDREESEE